MSDIPINNILEQINIVSMYTELHNEFIFKFKNTKHGMIKKYNAQKRYEAFFSFTENCCYWSRFNINPSTGKVDSSKISGKYLNELHQFYNQHSFYDTLYQKLYTIYSNLLQHSNLKTLSADSTFIRNIMGRFCSRNPFYNNKNGLKIHVIVDEFRTPVSLFITSADFSDTLSIDYLFNDSHMLIDKSLISQYSETFLADSAYYNLSNIDQLTSIGLDVIVGYNKQHIKKNNKIPAGSEAIISKFKKRGIVENFNADIQRYPGLLNNYQQTKESYRGLLMFRLCIYLSKKINKIIAERNNEALKIKRIEITKQKKIDNDKRKLQKEAIKKQKDEQKALLAKERELQKKQIQDRIYQAIWKNVDHENIRTIYNKGIANNNLVNDNKKKKGRPKDLSYKNYEDYMKRNIGEYIYKNKLINIVSYKFNKKTLYIANAKPYALMDNNIQNIMNNLDISEHLEECSIFEIL